MVQMQKEVRAEVLKRLEITSGNKLAKQLDVSSSYISQIKNGEIEHIGEAMWRKLANKLGISTQLGWEIIETRAYTTIFSMLKDAQDNSKFLCAYGATGVGKTTALRKYAAQNANAYYLLCEVTLTQKEFLDKICGALGIMPEGSKSQKITLIANALNKGEKSILILDDLGKVSDSIFRLVQLIYDRTEHSAGLFISGTEWLMEYVNKNRNKNKMGFRELYRRVQYWQEIPVSTPRDFKNIAMYYGIKEAKALHFISQKASCMGTLRNLIMNAQAYAEKNDKQEIDLEVLQACAN